ncbi:uncharacterized protein LOC118427436 [Branchiostoma floridae]|uniref:Uncharacterized protein LOC118427436 n=1 Tax=Branchiostoma floridae TaxID=7739 RepID=A0A9J7N6C8_BRAFL|nr:uncharacterized protein LOC118427436 [Branchiostoma floridae]
MAPLTRLTVLAALLGCAMSTMPISDITRCQYTGMDGHMYDLSPLRNGNYMFSADAYEIDSYNIYSPKGSAADPLTYKYYLNVCANVSHAPSACKKTAPILRVNPDGTCTALGNINAAIFDASPGADGVYLSYYHGDPSGGSRVFHYQSSVFFVCDNSTDITGPTFEHQSSCYHSHFRVLTKHACK